MHLENPIVFVGGEPLYSLDNSNPTIFYYSCDVIHGGS